MRITHRLRRQLRRARTAVARPGLAGGDGPDPSSFCPADWNRRYLPHHFPAAPADFHAWLDGQLRDLHDRRGSRLALIAPREGAKTTWVTLAYVLRCAVEGFEPYALILTDSLPQARKYVTAIKAELEGNSELRAAYPHATGRGPEWRSDAIRLRNGVMVEALGRGSKVRGRKDREHRPSLVVIDDCQNNRDVVSPADRGRALDWFHAEVIPAGSETSNFVSVGSALHRDSVAVVAQTLPGWVGRTFPAVLSWPDRMDLWDEWGRLATNALDDRRNETADRFLDSHRPEMERGAATFWPAYKPIAALMHRRAEIGPRRFETEYQGTPGQPDGALWPPAYFEHVPFDRWPDDLRVKVAWYDGAGETRDGDFHALVWLGLTPDGHLWFDADLWRGPPTEACRRVDDRCREFHPAVVGTETNFGLGQFVPLYGLWLRAENDRRPASEHRGPLPLRGFPQGEPKDVRIRTWLDPYLARRQVHVRNTPGGRLLLAQLRDYPHAERKDGPDAAAGCVRLAAYALGGR